MSAERDQLWVDLVQFDTTLADRVWDGDLRDLDAPPWCEHLGGLIHRARGPADPDELADEPVVVPIMSRVGAGAHARPGRSPVRAVGRTVAIKATPAATTLGMVGVATATTGVVATVAATLVVPAITREDPAARDDVTVTTGVEVTDPGDGTGPGITEGGDGATCPSTGDPCAGPGDAVVVDLPAERADAQAPAGGATQDPEAVDAEVQATTTVPESAAPATSDPAATTTEPAPTGSTSPAAGRAHGDPSSPVLPAPLVAGADTTDDLPAAPPAASAGGPSTQRPSPPDRAAAGAASAPG